MCKAIGTVHVGSHVSVYVESHLGDHVGSRVGTSVVGGAKRASQMGQGRKDDS